MNLNIIRTKNETEDSLLSATKNCEMFVTQNRNRAQETLEFKLTKPSETFSFKPFFNLGFDTNWTIGLPSLEAYNSVFNITGNNTKFGLYTDISDEFSFGKLKDEFEQILNISTIWHEHLQDETLGPRIISACKELENGERRTAGYYKLLLVYTTRPIWGSEIYLRNMVGLYEDNVQIILKQKNSNFSKYPLSRGIYTIKVISEAVYTMGDHDGALQIEYGDISMKTKLILKRFGGTFGKSGFDENSF